MVVNSADGSHRAVLAPSPDGEGVEVVLWQRRDIGPMRSHRHPYRCLGMWVLACPFHVALDEVHARVHPLTGVASASLHREKTTKLIYDADLGRVVETRRK